MEEGRKRRGKKWKREEKEGERKGKREEKDGERKGKREEKEGGRKCFLTSAYICSTTDSYTKQDVFYFSLNIFDKAVKMYKGPSARLAKTPEC